MTVRDLLKTALLKLGVIGPGDPDDFDMLNAALRVFNSMLDSWATERLLVYTIDRHVFALVSGQQTYTLGPGGDFNTTPLYGAGSPRPVKVENVWWQDPTSLEELYVEVIDEQRYQGLGVRNLSSPVVQLVYYKPAFPLGEVFCWPKPNQVANLVLYLWHPFNTATELDTAIVFPPGYQRALEFNLAVDLSSEYKGTLAAELVAFATEAKSKIQILNLSIDRLTSDAWRVNRRGSGGSLYSYNDFLTGRT